MLSTRQFYRELFRLPPDEDQLDTFRGCLWEPSRSKVCAASTHPVLDAFNINLQSQWYGDFYYSRHYLCFDAKGLCMVVLPYRLVS